MKNSCNFRSAFRNFDFQFWILSQIICYFGSIILCKDQSNTIIQKDIYRKILM